jgi:hypothetical protein
MALAGNPIHWLKQRRPIVNASWVNDMIALKRALQFCKGCEPKMPWRWQSLFNYRPFSMPDGRAYEGNGQCDWCRQERPIVLYQRTDSPEYEAGEKYDRMIAETRARETGFTVVDRRPWWRTN